MYLFIQFPICWIVTISKFEYNIHTVDMKRKLLGNGTLEINSSDITNQLTNITDLQ